MEENFFNTVLFSDELHHIATEPLKEEEIDEVCAKSSVYAFELVRNPHLSNEKKKEIAYQFISQRSLTDSVRFARHMKQYSCSSLLQLIRNDIRFPTESEFQNLLV